MNRIVNRVIKERPEDPLSTIAKYLLKEARKCYPTFDKLKARRVFIGGESSSTETLRIDVYLTYHGRSGLRYQYYFSFDPEEQNRILYDDQASKTGFSQAIDMINNAVTETIRANLGFSGLDLNAFRKLDGVLLKFYDQNLSSGSDPEAAPREENKTAMSNVRPGTQNSAAEAAV